MLPMDSSRYLKLIFDVDRIGFSEIAELILKYLDYQSLIYFKNTCSTIHRFISSTNIELMKERRKLMKDWKEGNENSTNIDVTGLVGCAKIYSQGRKIVVGVDQKIQIFSLHNLKNKTSRQVESLITISHHDAAIQCLEVNEADTDNVMIASGSSDGKLMLFNEYGEKLVDKQLFGRIEALKWVENVFITAHFGITYDAGCITVRDFRSPQDMPVIYSRYEDLYPIFCLDFNSRFISALEWSGTYNNVNGGNVNIMSMDLNHCVNLSEITDCTTYTCCRFLGSDILITGGHDQNILIWKLIGEFCDDIQLLHELQGHDGIIVRLELDLNFQRAISRDIGGGIIVWDISKINLPSKRRNKNDTNHHENDFLLKRIHSISKTVTCISMDKRQLLMGSIGHLNIFDFWNTA